MQAKFLKTYEKVLKVPTKEARNILSEDKELKVLRKEAKKALLELAKDVYYRILIVEEGLVLVPLVGSAAYKSFKQIQILGLLCLMVKKLTRPMKDLHHMLPLEYFLD